MKSTVFSICLACMLALVTATAGHAEPAAKTVDDPERIAAARELMQVMGVTKQMETMMSTMKQSFLKSAEGASEDKKASMARAFEDGIKNLLAYRDEMLTDFARVYAAHFTATEMRDVTKFYSSGTGKKFVELSPQLMQEGAAIGMKYAAKMMEEMKKHAPQ